VEISSVDLSRTFDDERLDGAGNCPTVPEHWSKTRKGQKAPRWLKGIGDFGSGIVAG